MENEKDNGMQNSIRERLISNREHKDGVFRKLFGSKEKILELYNAIEGTDYTDPDIITIQTIEDIIFNVYKNDLAFTVDNKFIILIEHQSTVNANIAIRMLLYVARLYEKIFPKKELYKSKHIPIPAPMMYVLYNGQAKKPEEQILRLSDLYADKSREICLELIVKVHKL